MVVVGKLSYEATVDVFHVYFDFVSGARSGSSTSGEMTSRLLTSSRRGCALHIFMRKCSTALQTFSILDCYRLPCLPLSAAQILLHPWNVDDLRPRSESLYQRGDDKILTTLLPPALYIMKVMVMIVMVTETVLGPW